MSNNPTGNLIIYQTEDGRAQVECRLVDETIWLSQALLGDLFDRSKKTISEHLQNLFTQGELDEHSVVRNFRTTAAELMVERADPAQSNMALTTWSGSRVRRHDTFDAQRRTHEAQAADAEDLKAIEALEKDLKRKGDRS